MAHLVEVDRAREQLRAAGLEPLILCYAPPEVTRRVVERERLSIPLLADLNRELYRHLRLRRVNFFHFLRPTVIFGFLWLILQGNLQRMLSGKEDVYQLGGDFIIDRQRRVLMAYPSREATDRPSLRRLLQSGST